jgi:hypothetical protein
MVLVRLDIRLIRTHGRHIQVRLNLSVTQSPSLLPYLAEDLLTTNALHWTDYMLASNDFGINQKLGRELGSSGHI